ncbi:MAG: glycine betaine/L-proline ABC transporter ATP-binding protein, partial [bacterium]|nr:glycine betaine/L-proline ABC transporter ATP-binding protein [bacterium]
MAEIQVNNLYKIFGPHPEEVFPLLQAEESKEDILKNTGCTVAVHDANFHVAEQEIFVVMGLSGSGKSTVLRCLNRLIEPTRGEVLIDGENIVQADDQRLREIRSSRISMVFQNFALLPHRTVSSNVEYGLEVRGVEKESRTDKAYQALELVGLKGYEESMPDELSGGMQQRVGLARALATDPEILLMDEAFSALDPLIRSEMQDELLNLQARMHKTIVFITHDLNEALKLGDRIAVMKDGQIVQVGGSEEILTEPADDYVRAFVQDVDRSRVITAKTVMLPAIPIQIPRDGPGLAVRRMREKGYASLYVTDRECRLKGLVSIENANSLLKQGIHS